MAPRNPKRRVIPGSRPARSGPQFGTRIGMGPPTAKEILEEEKQQQRNAYAPDPGLDPEGLYGGFSQLGFPTIRGFTPITGFPLRGFAHVGGFRRPGEPASPVVAGAESGASENPYDQIIGRLLQQMDMLQRKMTQLETDQFNDPEPLGPLGPESSATAGAQLTRYRVKSVENDYLVCRTWDGTTEGGVDKNVAKPFMLRHVDNNYPQIASLDTVDEQTVDVDDDEGLSERWRVVPAYYEDCEIFAVSAQTTGVDNNGELTEIDANLDGRAWAIE